MLALLPLFICNECVAVAQMYVPYSLIPNQFPKQSRQADNMVYFSTSMPCLHWIIFTLGL